MPAYTNPRPTGPEPGSDSGSRVSVSGGNQDKKPEREMLVAEGKEGVEEANRLLWGPETTTDFRKN